MIARNIVETRVDRHDNACVITQVDGRRNKFAELHVVFTVSYQGEDRKWLNRRSGSPFFDSLASARAKIDRN
jgi:hypothetical protein